RGKIRRTGVIPKILPLPSTRRPFCLPRNLPISRTQQPPLSQNCSESRRIPAIFCPTAMDRGDSADLPQFFDAGRGCPRLSGRPPVGLRTPLITELSPDRVLPCCRVHRTS